MNARELARGGLLAAVLSAGLWLVNLAPSGKLAGLIALSFVPGIFLRKGSKGTVALACLASVAVGFALGIAPGLLALYSAYFAWYALLWVATEAKRRGRMLRYLACQLSLAAAAGIYLALQQDAHFIGWYILAGEAAIVLFDFVFAFCVKFYDAHLARYFTRL